MRYKTLLIIFLFYANGLSQAPDIGGQSKSPYHIDLTREAVLIGGGTAMGLSGLMVVNNITPLTTEEIAALDPNDINPFDRNSIGRYREVQTGDVLLYASFLLPLNFLTNQNMRRDWKILAVIGAEVLLIQSGLNALVKGITSRTRPYVYDPDTPIDKKTSKDARVSFYSGHTATTAALSFYVAKVFSDYLDDTPTKTIIWAGAAIYPAVVGYLRVDSGHHFRTDVLAGYAMGALIGYFIPELHKVDNRRHLSVHYNFSTHFSGISCKFNF